MKNSDQWLTGLRDNFCYEFGISFAEQACGLPLPAGGAEEQAKAAFAAETTCREAEADGNERRSKKRTASPPLLDLLYRGYGYN